MKLIYFLLGVGIGFISCLIWITLNTEHEEYQETPKTFESFCEDFSGEMQCFSKDGNRLEITLNK